jgi:ABC-type lipoprotein export system ATPase subunit
MFEQLNAQDGITIIIVTHDALVAKHARQIIRLHDGLVVERAYGAAAVTTTRPAEPGAAR